MREVNNTLEGLHRLAKAWYGSVNLKIDQIDQISKGHKMEKLEDDLIKAYTANNYHTESVMVEAIRARRFDLLIHLAHIARLHFVSGYITKKDQDLRDRIANAIENGVEL